MSLGEAGMVVSGVSELLDSVERVWALFPVARSCREPRKLLREDVDGAVEADDEDDFERLKLFGSQSNDFLDLS